MFILKILYNLFIAIAVPAAIPVGYLVALKKKEDEDYFQRFGFITLPETPDSSVWFHCASVGEVRSLKSVTEYIREDFPELKIIISTTTASGKKMAEAELEPYFAFLLPLENSMAITHIIKQMNAKAVFIVDTELWPNMINSASTHSRLFLINGRISDRSFSSYKKFSFIFRRLLGKFETIYTKSDEDTNKFAKVKGSRSNISTLGNIKFQTRSEKISSGIFNFIKNHRIFAAASTHSGEEEIVLQAFSKSSRCDRLIIAPRHINRVQDVKKMVQEHGYTASMLAERDSSTDVVIVDRFGTLEELYQLSIKIFIGGSLNDTGGHNIFEALQFEKDVCVGPNMKNFQELAKLANTSGVSTTIRNAEELAYFIDQEQRELDFETFFEAMNAEQNQKLENLKEILQNVSDN
ncbi:MAG: 3-deoxy-D-manno-octulosonic acid transferase [Denitrovibrio sp.]|nr:MAG: 3-deoxy-D-manno-octulosonic acid transferase [Denitrovibrio sp.]